VEEESGKILDLLRKIPHFSALHEIYGSDYLALYLPLLSIFVLRQGLLLLDETDLYVLIEGKLQSTQDI
jgi:hypothetical protein